jgi:hypothetical protein
MAGQFYGLDHRLRKYYIPVYVKKDLRICCLRVMLTPPELEELRAYADRERLSMSTAVRRAALLAAERVAAAGLDPDPDSLETGTD